MLDSELDIALKALELSFHVRLIGTFAPDLIYAPASSDAASWLAQNNLDFDQFPVRDGNATVGILSRQSDHSGKTIYQAMQPLREGLVVSADMPLSDLIPQLRESHFLLILRGGRIDGLVTQSDLLKLPVRMLLFGLISHLEICLRALIRRRAPWPNWLEFLKPPRRQFVLTKFAELQIARFEPDPLEFLLFSDVVDVLSQQPDLGNNFKAEADPILTLRNDVAHAKTFISSADDVREFVGRFIRTSEMIDRVSQILKATQ